MPSVILLPESIVIPIVDGLTPESSSVTVHVIVGLLLTSVADAVGFVTVITGATFSWLYFTFKSDFFSQIHYCIAIYVSNCHVLSPFSMFYVR